MKLNFKIFKKGKPILWIVGAIVLFVVFYMITSRGAGSATSSGGITTISPGPSDAAVAANAQMAIAQLQYGSAVTAQANQANADVAVATLAANTAMAQIAAAADAGKYVASLDAATQAAYITAQRDIASTNAEYSLETARVAADTQMHQWDVNANILTTQMATNAAMFSDQLEASVKQTAIASITALPKKGYVKTRTAAIANLANL